MSDNITFATDSLVAFISATPKEADGLPSSNGIPSLSIIDNLSRNYGGKVRCVPLYGNKEGLPKVYNLSINQQQDADIVVLLHDDITVNDCLLFDKLEDARKRGLDIVGVAGSKGYQILNPL